MPRSVWLLVLGTFINITGSSLIWPLNTIYMHEHLEQSLSVAGFVLMINAGATMFGNLVGGYFFDKFGGYKSIMFGIFITVISLIGITIWHGWPHYVWFLTIMGFGSGIVIPVMFALVGSVWPEGGRKGFNAIYLAQNLGVAVGPAVGGIIADTSFDYLFVSNLVLYIGFFLLASISYRNMVPKMEKNKEKGVVVDQTSNRASMYSLLIISGGFLLTWVAYSQWASTLSTYIQQQGISLKEYSLLWTINGLLIILLQPIISPIVQKYEKQIKVQLIMGISIMMMSFIVIIFADSFKIFAISMIILTIGEIFVWPAVPTIANMLAPEGKGGSYQGIVNSIGSIGRMIGPLFGGLIVDLYSMNILILILCIMFLIAIVPCIFYDSPLKRVRN
ncbi:predicted MFS family arabinose efflux permease [Ureibacillus xyleni]|uniref:Predicted MFS family arabinose efflux permease n=1 Tax=Ureibacillus xyleni TaxID=614648 RepID=A0A285S849_9BACL|nr:MFS transporter [Ureibacillus xyleni]SOC03471.1 predicted MFS family arabinose efflux permease [Ureibacillus xyleni]